MKDLVGNESIMLRADTSSYIRSWVSSYERSWLKYKGKLIYKFCYKYYYKSWYKNLLKNLYKNLRKNLIDIFSWVETAANHLDAHTEALIKMTDNVPVLSNNINKLCNAADV